MCKMNARMKQWSTIARRYIAGVIGAKMCVQAFGVVEADKNAKMSPQPISGRWVKIEGSEARGRAERPSNHDPHETIKSVNIMSSNSCATHLCVVSLSFMFQTSSVQLVSIFSVLQLEASSFACSTISTSSAVPHTCD